MADKDQPEQVAAEERENPGQALREAREAQNVSLEAISAELRIEAHLLRALEEGRFEDLGAPVFARGYMRQYAARLGLDGSVLVEQCAAAIGDKEMRVVPTRGIRLRDARQLGNWIFAALVLALIAAALFVWWLNEPVPGPVAGGTPVTVPAPGDPGAARSLDAPVGDSSPARPADAETPPAAVEDTPDAASPGADPGAGDAGPAARADDAVAEPADSGSVESRDPAGAAVERAGQTGDATVPRPDPASEPPARDVASDGPGQTSVAADGLSPTVDGIGIEVAIEFTDECWVEISDATGRRLFYGLARAGDRRVIAGVAPVDVFLGNAEAAEISVDGREFTVPEEVRRGNLARFAIEAD